MANHFDLEEQEQLDELKHYWKQYGNAITAVATVVLLALAGWNLYQRWQGSQAAQAAAMLDEVQKVAQSHDADRLQRAFSDMKDRFPGTAYAPQAGLLAGKALYDLGKTDAAVGVLRWVADKSSDPGYAAVARLRLAGVLMDTKAYDEALKVLDANTAPEFAGLTADRRGDVDMAKGDKVQARAAYQQAYKAMDPQDQYRRLVEVKLNALGVDPTQDAAGKATSTVAAQ